MAVDNTEYKVLQKVRDRAENLGGVFPYSREGEALYLSTEEWRTLARVLNRLLIAEQVKLNNDDIKRKYRNVAGV